MTPLKLRDHLAQMVVSKRQSKAATKIQRWWRLRLLRLRSIRIFRIRCKAAQIIGMSIRSWLLTKVFPRRIMLIKQEKVIMVQKFCRGCIARRALLLDKVNKRVEALDTHFSKLLREVRIYS
jgi:hypothetical protein